jgi:hypothetical protein
MSFLGSGEGRFKWMTAMAGASRRKAAGCNQCGSRLEAIGVEPLNHSGKCANCESFISEDDEVFDELDD